MSGGWKQILKKGPVFAHASKGQVSSLLLAVFTISCITTPFSGLAFLLWLYLNAGFLGFLCRKKGVFFGIQGLFVTWVDHIVMFSGVVSGTVVLLRPGMLKKELHG